MKMQVLQWEMRETISEFYRKNSIIGRTMKLEVLLNLGACYRRFNRVVEKDAKQLNSWTKPRWWDDGLILGWKQNFILSEI